METIGKVDEKVSILRCLRLAATFGNPTIWLRALSRSVSTWWASLYCYSNKPRPNNAIVSWLSTRVSVISPLRLKPCCVILSGIRRWIERTDCVCWNNSNIYPADRHVRRRQFVRPFGPAILQQLLLQNLLAQGLHEDAETIISDVRVIVFYCCIVSFVIDLSPWKYHGHRRALWTNLGGFCHRSRSLTASMIELQLCH